MRVIIHRDLLAPAWSTISRIAKENQFPIMRAAMLTATATQGQGILTLIGMGMLGSVGICLHLPATVQQEGQVLLPASSLAEYLETLRSGNLTLSQLPDPTGQAEESQAGQAPSSLAYPEEAAPLVIESSYRSEAGTISTNQARLHTWTATQYALPPIQAWRRQTPLLTCTLPTASLKKALADTAAVACEQMRHQGKSQEMDGVLFRVTADALTLSATNGRLLVAQRFPLDPPPGSSCAALFEGKALRWVQQALTDTDTISVTLSRDEPPQKRVLLLEGANTTWFCQSMDVAPPMHWDTILQQPHEVELRVDTSHLQAALAFLAQAAHPSGAVALITEGRLLRMHTVRADDAVDAERTLPLVQPAAPVSILLNPKQLRRLVRLVADDVLSLEIGRMLRPEPQGQRTIGFLRISSQQRQAMMSLSREELRGKAEASTPQSQEAPFGPSPAHPVAVSSQA